MEAKREEGEIFNEHHVSTIKERRKEEESFHRPASETITERI